MDKKDEYSSGIKYNSITVHMISRESLKVFPNNTNTEFTNLLPKDVVPKSATDPEIAAASVSLLNEFKHPFLPNDNNTPSMILTLTRALPANHTIEEVDQFEKDDIVNLPSQLVSNKYDLIDELKANCNNMTGLRFEYDSGEYDQITIMYDGTSDDDVSVNELTLLIYDPLSSYLFDNAKKQRFTLNHTYTLNGHKFAAFPLTKWTPDLRRSKFAKFIESKSPLIDDIDIFMGGVVALQCPQVDSKLSSMYFDKNILRVFPINKVSRRQSGVHFSLHNSKKVVGDDKPALFRQHHSEITPLNYHTNEFEDLLFHKVEISALNQISLKLISSKNTALQTYAAEDAPPTIVKLVVRWKVKKELTSLMNIRVREAYIHVSSKKTSVLDVAALNVKNKFSVVLPQALEKSKYDTWHLALTSVTFPHVYEIPIPQDQLSMVVSIFEDVSNPLKKKKIAERKIIIPPDVCNIQDIVDSLRIQMPHQTWVGISNYGSLVIRKQKEHDLSITMSPDFYKFLGSCPMVEKSLDSDMGVSIDGGDIHIVVPKREHENLAVEFGTVPQFFKASPTSIFIECNILEPSVVGSKKRPILRTFPVTEFTLGRYCSKEFHHLEYHPVILSRPHIITFELKDENGKLVKFNQERKNEETHLNLHFTTNPPRA